MPLNELPSPPNGEVPTHPPRSAALWLAVMALHHIRYDYPPRDYFANEKIDANLEIVWVEYLAVNLEEMSKS